MWWRGQGIPGACAVPAPDCWGLLRRAQPLSLPPCRPLAPMLHAEQQRQRVAGRVGRQLGGLLTCAAAGAVEAERREHKERKEERVGGE